MEGNLRMAELMTMIKARQGEESTNSYAKRVGISEASLSRYYNAKREISIEAVRKFALFYLAEGDNEMLDALSSFALGIPN